MRTLRALLVLLPLAALLWWLPTLFRATPSPAAPSPAATSSALAPPVFVPTAFVSSPAPGPAPALASPSSPTAGPTAGPAAAPPPLALSTAPVLPEDFSPGVLRHWQGTLLTPLRARAPAPTDDFHLPLEFEFPLDGTRRVPVRVSRFNVTGADSGVFSGTVPDQPGSTVVLSFVGLAQAGVIHLPELHRAYVINGDEFGHLRITETDPRLAPGCTPPLRPPSPL